MSKSLLRLEARKYRRKGKSVKQIAKELHIAKSTASLWVRDIKLSIKQLEIIQKRAIRGAERGRLIGALVQKEARLKRIADEEKAGIKKFKKLSDKEFFVAGLALYAGEGNKKTRSIRFCNTDPKIIVFMISWFNKFFNITNFDLKCFIGINEIHRKRDNIIKNYWSNITGIPLKSFWKTSFKKTNSKKVYDNFNDHYGTLDIRVLRPAKIYYRIMGLIHGLLMAR